MFRVNLSADCKLRLLDYSRWEFQLRLLVVGDYSGGLIAPCAPIVVCVENKFN